MKEIDVTEVRGKLEREQELSWSHLLIKTARLLDEYVLQKIKEDREGIDGLRRAHLQLFPYIRLEGVRGSELVDRIGISKQAISQLVRELEEMNLVEQVPDPEDGRAKLIRFARSGQSVVEGVQAMRSAEKGLEHLWDEGQRGHMIEALRLLCNELTEQLEEE